MGTIRFSERRVINVLASLGLLVGMILPSMVPAFASAAEVTSRSIDLSSSVANAPSVTYNVSFKPVSNAGGFLIDFCSNTSIPGETCTAPGGLSTSGVGTTGSATVAAVTGNTAATVTDTLTGGTTYTVDLTGIHNPTNPETFYARIVTYDTGAHLTGLGHPTDNTSLTTGSTDSGGVALSTTNAIGVSASVLESMTFCASGTDTSVSTDANCINTGSTLTTPNLVLGVTNGAVTALQSNTLSTGTVYTQISTNASHGAVVNLKSNATDCGGLILAGDTSHCYISPASSGFSAGTADFGVKTATAAATTGDASASGTYEPAATTSYNSSTYFMHFVSGNASGVTSPYGDPLLDTGGAPVNDENIPLTFGASISNNTPAGNYSATLNLIATGTF